MVEITVTNIASQDLIQQFSDKVKISESNIKGLVSNLNRDPNMIYTTMDHLTPTQIIKIKETDTVPEHTLVIKREDLSPVSSFKLRGAYNKIKSLIDQGEKIEKLVTVSAGNHAQGVAWTAKKLGLEAVIFMPKSTPQSKVRAVKYFGGEFVSVDDVTLNFEDAKRKAKEFVEKHGYTMVDPFDDMDVIAGQATIFTEAAQQFKAYDLGDISRAYIQVGGGGMVAGMGTQAHLTNPECKIVPVEEEGQACLAEAFKMGAPTPLESVSTYCEGTAVGTIGATPFNLAQHWIKNSVLIVTKDEVDAAANKIISRLHATPETSASIGLAGYLQDIKNAPEKFNEGENVLIVISGANIDNNKLHMVTAEPEMRQNKKKSFEFELNEENGGLLSLIENIFSDVNVSSFDYGRHNAEKAYPILGFSAEPERLEQLEKLLKAMEIPYAERTEEEVNFARLDPCDRALLQESSFYNITFNEGAGSLRNLMKGVQDSAGLTFFRYQYQGGSEGVSLMAFEGDQKKLTDVFDLTEGILKYKAVPNPYHPKTFNAPSVDRNPA